MEGNNKIGVLQGSVLGPLLFNVFITDTFLFVNKTKICNYADETTIYACHTDLNTIIKNLEADGSIVANWLSSNFIKLNDDKCHLMIFGIFVSSMYVLYSFSLAATAFSCIQCIQC